MAGHEGRALVESEGDIAERLEAAGASVEERAAWAAFFKAKRAHAAALEAARASDAEGARAHLALANARAYWLACLKDLERFT